MLRRVFSSFYETARSANFATLSTADVDHFKTILPETSILQDNLTGYNQDWLGVFKGNSALTLKPSTTSQVSKILQYCNSRSLAVVPQSGNTGLVGGSVPVHDEIVISLANMNKILEFDRNSGIIRAEAGVILENLNSYAEDKGYIVPLDLGAKGSCFIGGNISTNAGGSRYIRYGTLHGSVTGLEAVVPNGDVLNSMYSMRKDNTGYDTKQLFIGAEGTLGIVTQVAMMLAPEPKNQQLAFLACESFERCIDIFRAARFELNEIVSAVEFMDSQAYELVLQSIPGVKRPFEEKHPFYCMIETSGSNEEHDREKVGTFIDNIFDKHVIDGVMAQDPGQFRDLWKLRESCAPASTVPGYSYQMDVSLPLNAYYSLVAETRQRVGQDGITIAYGHLGDCNLHLNVSIPDPEKITEVKTKLEPWIFEFIAKYNGSVSAEHGIGLQKIGALGYSKDETQVKYMKMVKDLFDPNGIMNPYKVIPN